MPRKDYKVVTMNLGNDQNKLEIWQAVRKHCGKSRSESDILWKLVEQYYFQIADGKTNRTQTAKILEVVERLEAKLDEAIEPLTHY